MREKCKCDCCSQDKPRIPEEHPIYSSYNSHAMDTLKHWKGVVDNTVAHIKAARIDFNFIAMQGSSGLFIAPAVAHACRKGCAMIRKEDEDSHGYEYEGCTLGGNYIILDDFVGRGSTVLRIIAGVNKFYAKVQRGAWNYSKWHTKTTFPVKCVAIFQHGKDTEFEFKSLDCEHPAEDRETHDTKYLKVPLFGSERKCVVNTVAWSRENKLFVPPTRKKKTI